MMCFGSHNACSKKETIKKQVLYFIISLVSIESLIKYFRINLIDVNHRFMNCFVFCFFTYLQFYVFFIFVLVITRKRTIVPEDKWDEVLPIHYSIYLMMYILSITFYNYAFYKTSGIIGYLLCFLFFGLVNSLTMIFKIALNC